MERKLIILAPFFEEPRRKFSIRELSRILNINHTTVRKDLNLLVKEGFLSSERDNVYRFYRLVFGKKTKNLKLYYNLEKIRKSGIVEKLEEDYDFPTIVLFGSYASATDDKDSDVDLCLISNIKKEFSAERYGERLNRTVSIHRFDKASFKRTNPHLVNNICKGIVLSGDLEVL
jgi:predicted nucleotidyltransferase